MILLSIPLLHVRSAVAAQVFYCRTLGFHLEFSHRTDPEREDPCYMGVSRDDVWLHLSSSLEDGVCGGVANFIVDNVDEIFADFEKRGVPVQTPPTDQAWGSREMYLTDPDGNSLRFIQPKSLLSAPEPEPDASNQRAVSEIQTAEWN